MVFGFHYETGRSLLMDVLRDTTVSAQGFTTIRLFAMSLNLGVPKPIHVGHTLVIRIVSGVLEGLFVTWITVPHRTLLGYFPPGVDHVVPKRTVTVPGVPGPVEGEHVLPMRGTKQRVVLQRLVVVMAIHDALLIQVVVPVAPVLQLVVETILSPLALDRVVQVEIDAVQRRTLVGILVEERSA